MFQQKITIQYRDGGVEEVVTDQGDVQAFELWALRRNIHAAAGRTLIQDAPILFMRVAAWNASQRNSGRKVDFDIWQDTVIEVTPEDVDEVPPGQPTTLDEPSLA